MKSGVIVCQANEGDYYAISIYNVKVIDSVFGLMENCGNRVVAKKVSDSDVEIEKFYTGIEKVIKYVNNSSILMQEKEKRITDEFLPKHSGIMIYQSPCGYYCAIPMMDSRYVKESFEALEKELGNKILGQIMTSSKEDYLAIKRGLESTLEVLNSPKLKMQDEDRSRIVEDLFSKTAVDLYKIEIYSR